MLTSLLETDWHVLATESLLSLLCTGSLCVWAYLLQRLRLGRPLLDWNSEPRADWKSAFSLVAVYIAISVISSSILTRFVAVETVERPVPEVRSVLNQTVFAVGLTLAMVLLSVRGAGSWSLVGITKHHLHEQFRVGGEGLLAAVIPTAAALLATAALRDAESQHSLLKLLMQSDDVLTLGTIVIAATVAAPLFEEMIYRVILQSWLSRLFSVSIAIPAVAVLFAFVHGWRDGLALLPLAMILGYVFHRTHSYVSVVVIHALFNATMLTLQLLSNRSQAGI